MKEIKKYKIGTDEYDFICETYSNSRAWGHIVTIFKNNLEIVEDKVRYYNRTWECFTFQTCMLSAINEIKEQIINRGINDYKSINNIGRFKKGEKDKVIEKIKNTNAEYKTYNKIYAEIYNSSKIGRFGGEIILESEE